MSKMCIEQETIFSAFRAYFEPSMRVLLNWKLAAEQSWPIRLSVQAGETDFSSLMTPWYVDGTSEVGYDCDRGHPVSVGQISALIGRLHSRRREHIQSLCTEMSSWRQPVQLTIPRYALRRGTFLLLDGSHRLAALAIARLPSRIMSFTIEGPIDPHVLPDLGHPWFREEAAR
jgi:hypothetical protein